MARPAKSVKNNKKKMSKAEIRAREKAEAEVVYDKTKPVPAPFLTKDGITVFNTLNGRNDTFTSSDSESLSLLARSLHRYTTLNEQLNVLDPLDDRCISLEKRIHAYDKAIVTHMTTLCIPLSQRLKLANDMAKVEIEQMKLQQMETPKPVEVNPLLAVLEATKNVK